MSDLTFSVLGVEVEPYAAVPVLTARLRIEEATGEAVHAIALRCQVRIEPQRRRYSDDEESGLLDMFGRRQRWGDTLKPFLWMHSTAMVQGFSESSEVDLPLPCTYDFDVAGAKYLSALHDGEIPLVFLFSGTVFTRGSTGFGVQQIPWNKDVTHRMPVQVWRDLIDTYFPNSGWVRMNRDTLDALAQFRFARGLTTWDDTVGALLAVAKEVVR